VQRLWASRSLTQAPLKLRPYGAIENWLI